MKSRRV